MHETEQSRHTPAPKAKPLWHNLDLLSTVAFSGAGILGIVSTINHVRLTFWNTFVIGGLTSGNTAFTPIRDKYRKEFQKIPADYAAKKITADEYRQAYKTVSRKFRDEAEDILLKDFKIPTKGFTGWTLGTIKRFGELRRNDQNNSFMAFAAGAAITVGAVSILRHSKDTLDRVEDKLDQLGERAR